MADETEHTSPAELSRGRATIILDEESLLAFQEWERLKREDKDALIWMAKEHPTLMAIVRGYKAIAWFVAVFLRLGLIAGSLTGILMAYRALTGS